MVQLVRPDRAVLLGDAAVGVGDAFRQHQAILGAFRVAQGLEAFAEAVPRLGQGTSLLCVDKATPAVALRSRLRYVRRLGLTENYGGRRGVCQLP